MSRRGREGAGEAAAVQFNRLEDRAALDDAHAALVGDVGVPDGVLRVERVNGGRVERLRFIPEEAESDLAPIGAHDHIVQQLREDLS